MTTTADQRAHDKLAGAGLRPTRQRLRLAGLLFAGECRHVTAEALHAEARAAGEPISLATVYNTLNAFTDAGLVRQVAVDGARVYFDTNVDAHHHFFDVDSGALTDIPAEAIDIGATPPAPDGAEVERIDVIVRVKRKPA